nr:hypothetical protein [Tanacetum cinerariifolium]
MRMEVLFEIHEVWDVVDLGSDNVKKNNIVKGLLFQAIPEDLVLQIRNLKTGKEMWDVIKNHNLGADRLSGIASKSAMLGEVMSEHKPVKKFLTSLPRRFVHIVAALEQFLDLKTMRFEDVEEGVAHTLEVVDKVEVKDVVEETRKTKDSWGGLLIKVLRSESRLYKAQLKVGKEDTNEVGRESGIKVSQGKDCLEIKQERYVMKILKEAEDEPQVEATQYQKMVSCLGTSPITWCSQKQTTLVLSSCEAEFMEATVAACQAI